MKPVFSVLAVIGLVVLAGLGYWMSRESIREGGSAQEAGLELTVDPVCDPTATQCRATGDGYQLGFRIEGPASPLKPFGIVVETDVPAERVVLRFDMVGMDMGVNQYRLREDEKGVWRAQVILPVCATGRRDWYATVRVSTAAGSPVVHGLKARFPFETQ